MVATLSLSLLYNVCTKYIIRRKIMSSSVKTVLHIIGWLIMVAGIIGGFGGCVSAMEDSPWLSMAFFLGGVIGGILGGLIPMWMAEVLGNLEDINRNTQPSTLDVNQNTPAANYASVTNNTPSEFSDTNGFCVKCEEISYTAKDKCPYCGHTYGQPI